MSTKGAEVKDMAEAVEAIQRVLERKKLDHYPVIKVQVKNSSRLK